MKRSKGQFLYKNKPPFAVSFPLYLDFSKTIRGVNLSYVNSLYNIL